MRGLFLVLPCNLFFAFSLPLLWFLSLLLSWSYHSIWYMVSRLTLQWNEVLDFNAKRIILATVEHASLDQTHWVTSWSLCPHISMLQHYVFALTRFSRRLLGVGDHSSAHVSNRWDCQFYRKRCGGAETMSVISKDARLLILPEIFKNIFKDARWWWVQVNFNCPAETNKVKEKKLSWMHLSAVADTLWPAWHRKIRSLLTHMSVSAREVDMIRYFYSITFQDAVEKISDNLSLTSKPQEALSWSSFPYTTWTNRNDHRKPVDGETPTTRKLRDSFQWCIFPSVAKSLTTKLGSIQSNTHGIDCLSSFFLWRFFSFLIMWR